MQGTPKRQLTLFDSTCLIMGIIIGAAIYQVVPLVANGTGVWWAFLGIWIVGGVLSLFGALGYAELATAYPKEGGDYVYLTNAYGPWAGFLFGWLQLVVVRPGDIACMAFVFATYAMSVWDPCRGAVLEYNSFYQSLGINAFKDPVPAGFIAYATGSVAVLTFLNILGVREGKWMQNLLTVVKVIGLLAIVGIAAFSGGGSMEPLAKTSVPPSLALILVLFAFGGWNEMAYVAAEIKDPNRNIVRAMVLGTVSVTVLYLIVNFSFLLSLGLSGIASSQAVAADAVSITFPKIAAAVIAALICISALGATNGLILTGARISYAVGADHRVFKPVGVWHPRTGTPIRALLLQGFITTLLIVALGSFVEAILYTAGVVYLFYFATSMAVIVLRFKEPKVERPFRIPGYPLTTLVFCAVCCFLIYSSVTYKPRIAAIAFGMLLLGIPVYALSNWLGKGPTGCDDG